MCCLHSGNMYAGISAPADHAGPSYLVPVVIVVMVVVYYFLLFFVVFNVIRYCDKHWF